jgi:hypothetical protein
MRLSVLTTMCRMAALLLGSLSAGTAAAQSVLTYHGDDRHSGLYVVRALSFARARGIALDSGFLPRFSGQLYAQPLYWQPPGTASGHLIVATEDDTAAAIDAVSGKTVWMRTLGQPVPKSDLPCGDIDQVGITGTPVIDGVSQTLIATSDRLDVGADGRLYAFSF